MESLSAKRLMVSIVAGAAALMLAGGTALAQAQPDKPAETQPKKDDAKKDEKKAEKKAEKKDDKAADPEIGSTAPAFKAQDIDGKDVDLGALTKSGKIVVLQWFNPGCPFVKKHYNGDHKTFNDLYTKYSSKDVAFVAINSGFPGQQGTGKETNVKAKKDWNIAYPIVLDESGDIGHKYNAKNTPLMVVIDKQGKIAYYGAIDDNSGADGPGKTNYVAKALDEMIAGTTVSTPKTKPYGCSVKYKDL
jgi:peroxiredoxin